MASGDGFTLIEVLVAMTLLAVGLVTLMELFSGSLSLAHSSRVYTTVTFLASQKMGEALLFEEEPTTSGRFEAPYDNFNYNIEISGGEESKWQLQIIDDSLAIIGEREQAASSTALRKIRVTISWEEGHREREFSLETLQAMVIKHEIEE